MTLRMLLGMYEKYSKKHPARYSMAQHRTAIPHGAAGHGQGTAGHGPARHCTVLRCWASAAVGSAERSRADDDDGPS